MEKLLKIQMELKAPKGQFNSFGKYKYRSVEDILESVKPLLEKEGVLLTITDELVNIGERYYIKATATLSDGEKQVSVNGYAREEEQKKGMDWSQITGASSSYARKYALNWLFLIDDTKDSDFTNTHDKEEKTTKPKMTQEQFEKAKEHLKDLDLVQWVDALDKIWLKYSMTPDQFKELDKIANSVF